MMGRFCWYVFWGVLIGFSLYLRYSKNYEFDFLGFLEVQRVLYKTNPVTSDFVFKYMGLSLLFYISAFFLSFLIDNNSFGLLHAKETTLSRGVFIFYVITLVIGSLYFLQKLEQSKSRFSGLYLTQITDRPDDFWSSSIQLNNQQQLDYQRDIARLNQSLVQFSETYQLTLFPIHYQHNPDQDFLMPLYKQVNSDSNLEVKFNFNQIHDHFNSLERDVIIEYLKLLSRGWLEKESKMIYLRGLAASWSQRTMDNTRIHQRLQFFLGYSDIFEQFKNAEWQSLYQDRGACLFDAWAAHFVDSISTSMPEHDWHQFIQTGLNLDHSWVPFHLLRSALSSNALAEDSIINQTLGLRLQAPENSAMALFQPKLFNYSLKSRVLYPEVFQLVLQMNKTNIKYKEVRVPYAIGNI